MWLNLPLYSAKNIQSMMSLIYISIKYSFSPSPLAPSHLLPPSSLPPSLPHTPLTHPLLLPLTHLLPPFIFPSLPSSPTPSLHHPSLPSITTPSLPHSITHLLLPSPTPPPSLIHPIPTVLPILTTYSLELVLWVT